MEALTHLSQGAMLATAAFLGIRHGLDLDHIATIDAMTRTSRQASISSRFIGTWFSLGHGAVVMAASVAISLSAKTMAPLWLEKVGAYISIFFLLLFAIINTFSFFRPYQGQKLYSPKSFLFTSFIKHQSGPLSTMAVGALFALSFDTISQVCLFSLAAKAEGALLFSLILAFFFTLGMVAADSINGFVMSFVLKKTQQFSKVLFNIVSIAITALSFIVALITIIQLLP